MIRDLLRVFLAVVLCAPILAGGQAPEEGSAGTIRVDTNLVIVDVVVTDANQNPVHNLTVADFELREDGKAQTIKTFEEHTADEAAKVPQPASLHTANPGVFTNDSPIPANGPLNIVLLDKLNTPLVDQAYCVDQLLEYINSAPAGTRIAILSLTSSQLFLLQGFTTDRDLLRAALSSKNATMRTSLYLDNLIEGDTGVIATGGGAKYGYRLQLTMEALNQLGRYLVQLPGRKNLLWLSTSFPISVLPMGTDNLFAHNQIAVYPISAHGLLADPWWDARNTGGGGLTGFIGLSESVKSTALSDAYNKWAAKDLADPTGGKALLNNDLKGNMARAIEAGSNYYTLTYSPISHDWNGHYREIQVQLGRQGLTLAYRRGYYATDPNGPVQPHQQKVGKTQPVPHNAMRTAMVRGSPQPAEVRFEASVRPSIANAELTLASGNQENPKVHGPYRRYSVHYLAHQRDIECPASKGGAHTCDVEFVACVYDAGGVLINMQRNEIKGTIKSAHYDALQQPGVHPGFQYRQEISVPVEGEYFLRVGVHDLTTDRIGAVELPVSAVSLLPPLSAMSAAPSLDK